MALDTQDRICKQFKLDRIGEVIQLGKGYEHESLHKKTDTDIFGFTGDGNIWVTLRLSMRAYLLMREEFPLSIPYLEKQEDHYTFHGPVASFDGIARFVMGLLDETKIIGPESLKNFVKEKLAANQL
jgi:proteasome accessory factor C